MIDIPVISRGLSLNVEKALFVNLQTAFSAFAKLQQDQCDGTAVPVADEGQILRFQADSRAAGNQLR